MARKNSSQPTKYTTPATNTFTTIQTGLDEVAVSGGPYSVSGSDIINLTEVAIGYNIPSTATDHSAEDTLSLTDEARDVIALAAIDHVVSD